MNGWISLHRKILDNPVVCKDSDYFAVWVYLILTATHEGMYKLFKKEKILLNPGELITSRKSISSKLKIQESKIERILKAFENEQQIEQQTSNACRLVKLVNYAEYQNIKQQDEQRMNNERTTDEQRMNTHNKGIRNNKEIREQSFEAKASCPESEKSAPNRKQKKQKITFNFETKKFEGIEESDLEFWKDSFPAVEIIPELKKIAAWLVSNPTKKKANYPRFITNWFSKTQDKGGNVGGNMAAKNTKENPRPMMTEKEQNSCPHFFEFLQKKITLAEVTRRTGKWFPDEQYLRCDGKPYSEEPDGEVIEIEPEEEEKTESIFSKGFGVLDLSGKMPF